MSVTFKTGKAYIAPAGAEPGQGEWTEVGEAFNAFRFTGVGEQSHREKLDVSRLMSFSTSMTVDKPHWRVVATLFGRLHRGMDISPQEELLWRLNRTWQGLEPGDPVNWKGLGPSPEETLHINNQT